MARRRHLIAYDIADERRLRRVVKVMESYGERLQYSVFLCDMSPGGLARWRSEILDVIDLSVDSVVVIDVGSPGQEDLTVIGAPRTLPRSGAMIV
ncbi:CRISPR-associated endonuclease Cas2 [Kytococcus schroeteri]|uniref:CRISPR-associated endoribonuclease Cas2 n=1 Tax=Kytococcus schroeteri TaxID=138300 RepID=A0A2I1PAC5_9MICO|nr:CRISPR-associated endonuclease Cas2 [Kytococcus schroeteri]PKZ41574.1 CRISPR-associated endonuclease Cas2 [Kytococcus schroeteri]